MKNPVFALLALTALAACAAPAPQTRTEVLALAPEAATAPETAPVAVPPASRFGAKPVPAASASAKAAPTPAVKPALPGLVEALQGKWTVTDPAGVEAGRGAIVRFVPYPGYGTVLHTGAWETADGCNTRTGLYDLRGATITTANVLSTLLGCINPATPDKLEHWVSPEAQAKADLVTALFIQGTLAVSGDTLTVTRPDGKAVRLTRAAQ